PPHSLYFSLISCSLCFLYIFSLPVLSCSYGHILLCFLQAVAPLREKIRELELSFTQKYPPVKFLSEKDRKRILITGGAGFVGSHLTDKLMMDGHEVTVVDNFFTGRKRNVEHWIGHENFELINHDVVEPLYIE
ncbi:UDP-glucuronic acid decarboxylase 1-like, partial [Sinocyclocheilus grahami]|uniref:UDP-glucuronic acid decarboxylase 1-like n=1 Tax=Sinocyclocheilus grahami TaxID=75366 RepID=UPI0007AC76F5